MAATQRPVAAFTDPTGPLAWKTLPSWTVVATSDKAFGTDVVRSQVQRASADIVEVEGCHMIMISSPGGSTTVFVKAARSVASAHG